MVVGDVGGAVIDDYWSDWLGRPLLVAYYYLVS